MIRHPVWIEKVVTVAASKQVMFYPLSGAEPYVEQGMKVGYVTDYLGKVVFEAAARPWQA